MLIRLTQVSSKSYKTEYERRAVWINSDMIGLVIGIDDYTLQTNERPLVSNRGDDQTAPTCVVFSPIGNETPRFFDQDPSYIMGVMNGSIVQNYDADKEDWHHVQS